MRTARQAFIGCMAAGVFLMIAAIVECPTHGR